MTETERLVKEYGELLKSKGQVYFKKIEKKCTVTGLTYYKGEGNICVSVKWGFGASEQKEDFVFEEKELDEYVAMFLSKKEIEHKHDTTEIVKPKPETPSPQSLNNLTEMRSILFKAMRDLQGGSMGANEAKSMACLAQTIINSAKAEIDYKIMFDKAPKVQMLE